MHGRLFLSVNHLSFYTCFFKWEESVRQQSTREIALSNAHAVCLAQCGLRRYRQCHAREISETGAQRDQDPHEERRPIRLRQLHTERENLHCHLSPVAERATRTGEFPSYGRWRSSSALLLG